MDDNVKDIIVECQEEILAVNPDSYYKNYSKNELLRWGSIPQWIYEDRLNLPVRCLDIGPGYGSLTVFCANISRGSFYCIDFRSCYFHPALIKKYNVHFIPGNFEFIYPIVEGNFDIVILAEVLEHFNYFPLPTITRIRELLSENGRLYLCTPSSEMVGTRGDYDSWEAMPLPPVCYEEHKYLDKHIHHYSRKELRKLFFEAELIVDRFEAPVRREEGSYRFSLRKA